jgi:hypothetical protein
MAGEYADAISRVGDLIATTHDNSIYHTIQVRTQRDAMISAVIDFIFRRTCTFSSEIRASSTRTSKVQ